MQERDVIVVGGGPAGLAAACLTAEEGVATTLIAAQTAADDPRTVALMRPSIDLLAHLGVWPEPLCEVSAALRRLRLVDDSGGMFKGPDICFAASEIGLEAFGWNIALSALIEALTARAATLGVELVRAPVTAVVASDDACELTCSHGIFSARLALAADGAASLLRNAAGIKVRRWSYDQEALATSFAHSAAHDHTSREYHRAGGPFTTVPLPGLRSSLVWMERPPRINELMAMDDRRLAAEIQLACHGELGRISDVGPRKAFPMRGLLAEQFAGNRIMLLGEAGHVVPPIGAQGLNMSLRDAAHAAELACDAIAAGADPGGPGVLSAYQAARRFDVTARQALIDTTNRTLLSGSEVFAAARNLGLTAIGSLPFLRQRVMRAGLGPVSGLPRIMGG
jgi:2-octaprenyl-6-methoxyphenol hydroxylase